MSRKIKSLQAADFKRIIGDKNVQLVDVRTPEEYRGGTIAHALLIDVCSPRFAEQVEEQLNASRPVAVFCHSGARSIYAAKVLAEKGFPVVYNLSGGIVFWR